MPEQLYRVKQKLLIPQGPGKVPSTMRADENEIISFDGDEPIDVALLLKVGAIEPFAPPTKPKKPKGTKGAKNG